MTLEYFIRENKDVFNHVEIFQRKINKCIKIIRFDVYLNVRENLFMIKYDDGKSAEI